MQEINGFVSSYTTYYNGTSQAVKSFKIEAAHISCCPSGIDIEITHTNTSDIDTQTTNRTLLGNTTHYQTAFTSGCLYTSFGTCFDRKVTRIRARVPDDSGLCGSISIKTKFCVKVWTNDDFTGTQYNLV